MVIDAGIPVTKQGFRIRVSSICIPSIPAGFHYPLSEHSHIVFKYKNPVALIACRFFENSFRKKSLYKIVSCFGRKPGDALNILYRHHGFGKSACRKIDPCFARLPIVRIFSRSIDAFKLIILVRVDTPISAV